jgi:transcriptional regulator with XRE-family HTH domain
MNLGETIKTIREEKGMLQKQVALDLGIGYTNYNKIENGKREPSVKELQLLAKLFSLSTDQILNYEGELPKEINIENKKDFEKIDLINNLEDDDKQTVFKIIDTMLTKKKFKDFFNKNVSTL